jgi:hypothetical protein
MPRIFCLCVIIKTMIETEHKSSNMSITQTLHSTIEQTKRITQLSYLLHSGMFECSKINYPRKSSTLYPSEKDITYSIVSHKYACQPFV